MVNYYKTIDGFICPQLLYGADTGVYHHNCQNDERIYVLSISSKPGDAKGNSRSGQQDQHHAILKLPQEPAQQPLPLFLAEPIGPIPSLPALPFPLPQTPAGVCLQRLQNLVRAAAVKIHLFCPPRQ